MTRKGVYPYEYIDSKERFLEQSCLPSKDNFYSTLRTKITHTLKTSGGCLRCRLCIYLSKTASE